MMHADAPGGKRRTQNRVQPTASDCSDSLFFIRKMRCESTHFGVKFSKAPLRGGRRYAPCTPAQDRAAVWRKNGFEPHFGAILDFFDLGKRRMFPRTQHWPLSKTPFVLCGVSPLRHTHRREKTSDRKHLDSGGWGCRMMRLFSHENGL